MRKCSRLSKPTVVLYAVWLVLLGVVADGFTSGMFVASFIGLATMFLTVLPLYSSWWLRIELPSGIVVAIAVFLCATLVLGEVGEFYARYWWWDIALHAGSAVGFGLLGVILMLILVGGDKLSAAPVTVAFFAFCFAVMVGVVWEIFEFTVDQTFGLNMQKSGLIDTMADLIVDCIGAAVGSSVGFVHIKGLKGGPLSATLRDFVHRNGRLFDRS